MSALYAVAFLAGIFSFLSPCIVPMLTAYFSLILGQHPSNLDAAGPSLKRRALLNTLAFIAAFTLVFTLAGGAAGSVGRLLLQRAGLFNLIGGLFLVFLAFSFLGILHLPHVKHAIPALLVALAGSPIASFGGGLFFAIACSHCLGPTLYSILLAAGATGTVASGMLVMFTFSLGLAVPYLVVGTCLERALPILGKNRVAAAFITRLAGVLLLLFGVLILTGRFTLLTAWAARLLPFSRPLGM